MVSFFFRPMRLSMGLWVWGLWCKVDSFPSMGDQGLAAPETRNSSTSCWRIYK